MIRVLHVIDSLDLGGAQAVVVNLARFRDREKFNMTVAPMHGRGVFAGALEAEGVRVVELSAAKVPPAYLWALPRLLRGVRFDVAHFHLFGSNWIAKPLAAACGVRVRINHDHCNDRARAGWRLAADRFTNRWSSHVLAVSRSTADDLVGRVGLSPRLVTCLPNGVDTEYFRPAGDFDRLRAKRALGLPADKTVVAGLGRLHPQKNWPLFLKVAARFPQAEFVIAGTGPQESELQASAGGNVRFAGFRDPREVFAAADVFVLTSDYEGMPMTLLEAMASGLPSVVSAVDGCRDILGDGAGGFLAQAGNAEDFASKLSRLMESGESRQTMGDLARAKAKASFDARAQTKVVEDLYGTLLQT
ncbi:MAG: glycosyltransferase [Chthoniobacterales bacterium]|nr:glycosyltransferase [Chthoniobacterales bacterium]